jgi:hypothetical protein
MTREQAKASSMNKVSGRAPAGQALVASDEARSDLHHMGFDPSRIIPVRAEALGALLGCVLWSGSMPDWSGFWDWDYVVQSVFDNKVLGLKFEAGISPSEFVELLKIVPDFVIPEELAQAIEARRAATGNTDAVEDESAVAESDAHNKDRS